MYLLGFSLNNLSLMALTISTGFVVDDAIVMIENIARYIEAGETPLAGGAQGFEADRLHHPVADRLAHRGAHSRFCSWATWWDGCSGSSPSPSGVTILISAVVSLTLTPMMCARILKHMPEEKQGRFYRASQRDLRQDHRSLRKDPAMGASSTRRRRFWWRWARWSSRSCSISSFRRASFPVQDTGVIHGHFRSAAVDLLFRDGRARSRRLARVILKDPAVESLSSFIGVDGTNTTLNSGRILINLKPLEERDASASEVIRRLQPELAKVEGITLYMQPVQDLTVDARVSRTQYQYTLEDPDADELNTLGAEGGRSAAHAARSCAT